jgi:cardiolipin synthase (CMP-forming)
MSLERRLPRSPGSSERHLWLTIPNAITLLRLLAVVPFFYLVTRGNDRGALILFVAAGITDSLDGVIARRLGQTSKYGRLLDPIVDKLFTGVSYVALSAFRRGLPHIPTGIMAAVLARDALILAGSLLVYGKSRNSGFKPSVYGKLNTFIEIGVVVCFLAASDIRPIAPMLPFFYVLLLVSIVLSAVDYTRTGLRMMQAQE